MPRPRTIDDATVLDAAGDLLGRLAVSGARLLLATHGDRRGADLEPWESRLFLLG